MSALICQECGGGDPLDTLGDEGLWICSGCGGNMLSASVSRAVAVLNDHIRAGARAYSTECASRSPGTLKAMQLGETLENNRAHRLALFTGEAERNRAQ